jgi:hypothetical protein
MFRAHRLPADFIRARGTVALTIADSQAANALIKAAVKLVLVAFTRRALLISGETVFVGQLHA